MLPSPETFLFLRLLNLTLCRNLMLGSLIRRSIVKGLITRRHIGPFRLRRTIVFNDRNISFEDAIDSHAHAEVRAVELPRSFTAIHMGSAKYFHRSELRQTFQPHVGGMRDDLNRSGLARVTFKLDFGCAS
jgi:hypothetical protein